jgi:pyridoxamine 5'-phosphate oxidase
VDLDDLAGLRREYQSAGLDEADVDPDPFVQFGRWFAEWRGLAVGEPNAMVLATATPDGRPSARTVLLKGVGAGGFVFHTNYASRKGRQLADNPGAALVFSWHPVGRQVLVEGAAERLTAEASDAYWAIRPRGSRLGAVASPQSAVVPDRKAVDEMLAAAESRYAGVDIPRPAHWGGYRVVPDSVEFWQGRENRVHDRLVYRRDPSMPTGWRLERLAP